MSQEEKEKLRTIGNWKHIQAIPSFENRDARASTFSHSSSDSSGSYCINLDYEEENKQQQVPEDTDNKWKVDDSQMQHYLRVFELSDEDKDGILTASQAKTLFASSGLEAEVLGKIWDIVHTDTNDKTRMNFKQYALFMCITRAKQKGEQLPISLPSQLVDMVDNFIANIHKNVLKHPKHRTMQETKGFSLGSRRNNSPNNVSQASIQLTSTLRSSGDHRLSGELLRSSEIAQSWDNNLEPQTLLQDPVQVQQFKKFLESEGSNNEILFVMDVESFRRLVPGSHFLNPTQLQTAKAIYLKYISTKSSTKVEVSKQAKQKIRRQFKESATMKGEVFDEALSEVSDYLKTKHFTRFVKSTMFLAMYNSFMDRKPYELPEKFWNDFVRACMGGVEDNWVFKTEKTGVVVHHKKFHGDVSSCYRGSCVMPVSAAEFYPFAVATKLRYRWDKYVISIEELEVLDASNNTVIYRYEYKPPKWAPAFANNDYVIIRAEKRLPDGTIMVVSRSVVHPKAPKKPKVERAECILGGFLIQPHTETTCIVTYVYDSNLAGKAPHWAKEILLSKRVLILGTIRKIIQKEVIKKGKTVLEIAEMAPAELTKQPSDDLSLEVYLIDYSQFNEQTIEFRKFFERIGIPIDRAKKYADNCTNNGVDMELLKKMNESDLEKIDINVVGDRMKILKEFSANKNNFSPDIYLSDIRILGVLDSGAFGSVYKGFWNDTTLVALKKLHQNTNNAEFVAEATMLMKLKHPNVLTFYGISKIDNDEYIVTEFMSQGSVKDLLETEARSIQLPDILQILIDVSAGMIYLSKQNIIHRDLASRNLLVKRESGQIHVKIADFGLSKTLDAKDYYVSSNDKFARKWASPEVLTHNKFSTKSDVWAFGVTCWELCEYGKLPFPQLTNAEASDHVLKGGRLPQPLLCPDELYDLMKSCWEEDPAKRPNFEVIHDALLHISSNLGLHTDTKSSSPKERRLRDSTVNTVSEYD